MISYKNDCYLFLSAFASIQSFDDFDQSVMLLDCLLAINTELDYGSRLLLQNVRLTI